jgi:regulator of extracellular matrix RemA (YlzA/DUF370 family)
LSRLKDLVSKGVRLIVADPEAGAEASPTPTAVPEREIPAEAFQEEPEPVRRSQVAASVEDFGAVYQEAGIELPLHGYGVDKVAEMLESKRLASLGREVKATAVMAALEAAQVPIREVIQDAVLRDKALDAFEAAKEREVSELRAQSEARVSAIQSEMETYLREKNAEIEALKQAGEAAGQAFQKLQERKRREEQRLHDVVAHFIEGAENPVTAGPSPKGGDNPPSV